MLPKTAMTAGERAARAEAGRLRKALEDQCEWLAGARDGLLSVGDELRARLAEARRAELSEVLHQGASE